MKLTIPKVLAIIFLMTLVCVKESTGQQLPQFSQYIFNGLHINPGYAGYRNQGYLQATYRSQWLDFPGSPKTLTVTGDFSANEGTMGFGFSFLQDKIGPTRTSAGLLTYAYRLKVGDNSYLGLGVSGGVSEYAIDRSMLSVNDPDDNYLETGTENLFTPNLNSGLFFHTDRFYAGLSAYNMIGKKALERKDIALAYHDFHYYLTFGALIPLSNQVKLKPSVLIKEVKGVPTNYDLTALFLFHERLWLGGSYRSNAKLWKDNLDDNLHARNAVALIIEFFATDQFRIGYAYDQNMNVLQDLRNNSHEISLGYYLFPRKVSMSNQRWF